MLYEEIENISTRQDFVQFIKSLSDDFISNSDSWENHNVPNYLDALAGWVSDMKGYYENRGEVLPADIPWKFFADVLHAAKLYE